MKPDFLDSQVYHESGLAFCCVTRLTQKSHSSSLSCSKLKVTSNKIKLSGFNDNYLVLFYMIYIIM